MSPGMANPTTCPRCLGPLAYGHAGATRIFRGSCCDKSPRLRAAGDQADVRHRVQLRVVARVAFPAAAPAAIPVADAVEQRDRAERLPARSRRAAEALEESARSLDRPPRPRPRREAARAGHRRGEIRALAVVEDERDVAVLLQPVLDDLGAHPPDVSLVAGRARRRRAARRVARARSSSRGSSRKRRSGWRAWAPTLPRRSRSSPRRSEA